MTSTKSSESQIHKVDSRRCPRVSQSRRDAILDEFERSGLTGTAFAKLHGLNYSTFASWSLKRRKQATNSPRPLNFAEVIIAQDDPKPSWHPPGTLQVHLPGGAWLLLDGDDAQSTLAAHFLKTLQA